MLTILVCFLTDTSFFQIVLGSLLIGTSPVLCMFQNDLFYLSYFGPVCLYVVHKCFLVFPVVGAEREKCLLKANYDYSQWEEETCLPLGFITLISIGYF